MSKMMITAIPMGQKISSKNLMTSVCLTANIVSSVFWVFECLRKSEGDVSICFSQLEISELKLVNPLLQRLVRVVH